MTGRLVERQSLASSDRAAMFALLGAHFLGVTRDQFDRDLDEKNYVVLIERDDELLGFSTIHAYETEVDGERLSVVYSGDTIVAPAAWGSAAFPRAWIHSVYQLRAQFPNGTLLWLLLTSGFRTYRFLPVFWQEFFPRVGIETPPRWNTLLQTLATRRFGSRFDARQGIVRLDHPQELRGTLSEIPPSRLDDPDIAYFLSRNPRHAAGDELVCIADLSPDNLTPAGRRVVYGARK